MDTGPKSDADLMAAVAGGHMAALEELVRRHQESVMAVAYRFLGRWHLAEDVAQDVFIRIHHAAGDYRPEAKFTTWLYRIVVNRCFDLKRGESRRPVSMGDMPADPPGDAPPDPIDARETAGRVQQAVGDLPDRQRTAVVLHRYDGLSHREIAEVTGWSESAVESLLVRGYAGLREALADMDEIGRSDRRETA